MKNIFTVKKLIAKLSKIKDQDIPIAFYVGDDEYAAELITAKQIKLLHDGMGYLPYYPDVDKEYIQEARSRGEDLRPIKFLVFSNEETLP